MKTYLLPYKRYSDSAGDLASLLEVLYIRFPENMLHIDGTVINWGCSNTHLTADTWINHPEMIKVSNNKLLAFQKLKEHNVSIPYFTTSAEEAATWVDNGHLVFARTKLSGHSGAGIVIVTDTNSIPNAPLFVKYVKKAAEYRVHVAFDEVIDVQQKRRANNFAGEPSFQIRSHKNGWVYCREGVSYDERIATLARGVLGSLSLDFGAVDIIYNKKKDQYYVLEVNTAPGLEGETLYTYFNTFHSYLNHV